MMVYLIKTFRNIDFLIYFENKIISGAVVLIYKRLHQGTYFHSLWSKQNENLPAKQKSEKEGRWTLRLRPRNRYTLWRDVTGVQQVASLLFFQFCLNLDHLNLSQARQQKICHDLCCTFNKRADNYHRNKLTNLELSI